MSQGLKPKKRKKCAKGSTITWVVPGMKEAISAHRKQSRASRQRSNIEWTVVPPGGTMARQNFPTAYREPVNVDPAIAEKFVVGRPVMAKVALSPSANKGVYVYTPLEPYRGPPEGAHIPAGSLLVYVGSVRETERTYREGMFGSQRPHDVMAVKHTFITPMGRCIIHDFNLITLIEE